VKLLEAIEKTKEEKGFLIIYNPIKRGVAIKFVGVE
jgi:hypothetical protein